MTSVPTPTGGDVPRSSPYRSTPDAAIDDGERSRLNERLNAAFAAGTLSQDEYSERMDRLYAANRLGELVPVVSGLPPVATYDQPANVVAQLGATATGPGELAPTRSGVPLAVAVGGGVVLALILVVILLIALL